MKYSKQKDEMLKLMRSGKLNHPNAAEVFAAMKLLMPGIGIATVYRNLNAFVEAGMLARVSMSGEPDRFDFRLDSHNHALCVKCGKVFDFESNSLKALSKKLLEQSGFRVSSANIFVSGVCEKCARAAES